MESVEDSGWNSGDSYMVSPSSDLVSSPPEVLPTGGSEYAEVNHRSPPPLPSSPPPPSLPTFKQMEEEGSGRNPGDMDDILVLDSCGPDEDVLLAKGPGPEAAAAETSPDEGDAAHPGSPNGDLNREAASLKNSEILNQFQEPESDCGVDCLYYAVTCCECSVM